MVYKDPAGGVQLRRYRKFIVNSRLRAQGTSARMRLRHGTRPHQVCICAYRPEHEKKRLTMPIIRREGLQIVFHFRWLMIMDSPLCPAPPKMSAQAHVPRTTGSFWLWSQGGGSLAGASGLGAKPVGATATLTATCHGCARCAVQLPCQELRSWRAGPLTAKRCRHRRARLLPTTTSVSRAPGQPSTAGT